MQLPACFYSVYVAFYLFIIDVEWEDISVTEEEEAWSCSSLSGIETIEDTLETSVTTDLELSPQRSYVGTLNDVTTDDTSTGYYLQ